MKEYWTDETGLAHRILFDGRDYIVIDGDDTVYLEDEDIYDEEELEDEEPLSEDDYWYIEGDKRYDEMIDKMMFGELY